jgi:hypothetical protein
MSLSPAVAREAFHTRRIHCQGYRREDGLWDIEGTLTDTKSYAYDSTDRGRVEAGEPVHHMHLRLTVDDDLTVQEVEAATEAGPFTICGGYLADLWPTGGCPHRAGMAPRGVKTLRWCARLHPSDRPAAGADRGHGISDGTPRANGAKRRGGEASLARHLPCAGERQCRRPPANGRRSIPGRKPGWRLNVSGRTCDDLSSRRPPFLAGNPEAPSQRFHISVTRSSCATAAGGRRPIGDPDWQPRWRWRPSRDDRVVAGARNREPTKGAA